MKIYSQALRIGPRISEYQWCRQRAISWFRRADRSSQYPIQHLRQRRNLRLGFDPQADLAQFKLDSAIGIGNGLFEVGVVSARRTPGWRWGRGRARPRPPIPATTPPMRALTPTGGGDNGTEIRGKDGLKIGLILEICGHKCCAKIRPWMTLFK